MTNTTNDDQEFLFWFASPQVLLQNLSVIIEPFLKSNKNRKIRINVIVDLEGEESSSSVRFQYGVLYYVYQRITYLAKIFDEVLLANMDLRVFLSPISDIQKIINSSNYNMKLICLQDEADRDQFIGRHKEHFKDSSLSSLTFQTNPCESSEPSIFIPSSPLLPAVPDSNQYSVVALGGTFDHLHSGHKLMLSLACLITHDQVICGVTAAEMLTSKTHPQYIEDLSERIVRTEEFLRLFKSELCDGRIKMVTLRDHFGPTIEMDDIDALVVSPETLPGGLKINEIRIRKHLKPLDVIQVDYVVVDETLPEVKLSSTFIRGHLS